MASVREETQSAAELVLSASQRENSDGMHDTEYNTSVADSSSQTFENTIKETEREPRGKTGLKQSSNGLCSKAANIALSPYLEPLTNYIVKSSRIGHGLQVRKLPSKVLKKSTNQDSTKMHERLPQLDVQPERTIVVQRGTKGVKLMTIEELEAYNSKVKSLKKRERLAARFKARQGESLVQISLKNSKLKQTKKSEKKKQAKKHLTNGGTSEKFSVDAKDEQEANDSTEPLKPTLTPKSTKSVGSLNSVTSKTAQLSRGTVHCTPRSDLERFGSEANFAALQKSRQDSNSTFCSDLQIPEGPLFGEGTNEKDEGSVLISPMNESGDPEFKNTKWPPELGDDEEVKSTA